MTLVSGLRASFLTPVTPLAAYRQLSQLVFFNFISMKVLQTITRRYPNGKTFTWKFGQLPDGRYAAKGLETGRKVIFKSKGAYNQRFRYMTWTLGYTPVVEQLALPL